MSNHYSSTARLGADPELRYTNTGKAVANLRVVDQERRKNDQTGHWEDAGEPLWLSVSLWGAKAEALANEARKGDLVTVTGRLVARSYEKDGVKHTVHEVKAQEVAVVPRTDKAQSSQWGQPSQPQEQAWGQPAYNTPEAPF